MHQAAFADIARVVLLEPPAGRQATKPKHAWCLPRSLHKPGLKW